MAHEQGSVNDPERDQRVTDTERFLDDRRREALAMIRLWRRSGKPHAADELRYWRGVLAEVDAKAARLGQREGRKQTRIRDEPPD